MVEVNCIGYLGAKTAHALPGLPNGWNSPRGREGFPLSTAWELGLQCIQDHGFMSNPLPATPEYPSTSGLEINPQLAYQAGNTPESI